MSDLIVKLSFLFAFLPHGGLLFAPNLWLKITSLGSIVNYTFITSTGTAILCYNALKSALTEKEPSEVLRVPAYISLNAEDLYRKLLDMYIRVWGSKPGGISALERDIQSCMKQGFNRCHSPFSKSPPE